MAKRDARAIIVLTKVKDKKNVIRFSLNKKAIEIMSLNKKENEMVLFFTKDGMVLKKPSIDSKNILYLSKSSQFTSSCNEPENRIGKYLIEVVSEDEYLLVPLGKIEID